MKKMNLIKNFYEEKNMKKVILTIDEMGFNLAELMKELNDYFDSESVVFIMHRYLLYKGI